MPTAQADFFVLQAGLDRIEALCVITEYHYFKQRTLYLHCDDQKQAEMVDEALWQFKPGAFIPHNLVGEGPDKNPPVQVGHGATSPQRGDVLIQVGLTLHPNFRYFRHLIECVDDDETTKQALRQHFVQLKQHHYTIETHTGQTLASLVEDRIAV